MARRKKGHQESDDEFPLLNSLSLYASHTTGDGNCLFRALSDQLYGSEDKHAEVRRRCVAYLLEHADHFSAFIGEYGETWEHYIQRMGRDGTYGGHLEIVGFAESYGLEVVIYQAEFMYAVHPSSAVKPNGKVHIAYHTWEHYSSVRNKAGPHQGLPEVAPVPDEDFGNSNVVIDSSRDNVPRWKVEIVLRSVPDAVESKVYDMLQTRDHGDVIEELLMHQFDDNDDVPECRQKSNSDSSEVSAQETLRDQTNLGHVEAPVAQGKNPKKTAKQKRVENRQNKLEKKMRRSKANATNAGTPEQATMATSNNGSCEQPARNSPTIVHI